MKSTVKGRCQAAGVQLPSPYSWRSDLSRTQVLSDTSFAEYTKDGFETVFTVTLEKPPERWEFHMDNANMQGHWTGVFTARDGETLLELTEDVQPKKLIMKPFVKAYLKKQQEQFAADLKKALGCQ